MNHLESIIGRFLQLKDKVILAIDGPCGSGKSTYALLLSEKYDANLFHMDDFFLRPEQRTSTRLNEPGGNVDYERFDSEVLSNFLKGFPFKYRPYSCSEGKLDNEIEVPFKKLNIVEGVYSMHPSLASFYDIKVFMKVSRKEQIKRITKRNGKIGAERFIKEWMPLENLYFSHYKIENQCDITLDGISLEAL